MTAAAPERGGSGDDTDRFLADLAEFGLRLGLRPGTEDDRIPRIVHLIWLDGPRSFGPTHYLAIRSAHEVHRPERILLYAEREPIDNEWWARAMQIAMFVPVRPPTMLNGRRIPWLHHRADLMRILILHTFGGIYLDLDVISLRTVEGLLDHRIVMAREGDKGLGSCVILARSGERFLAEWINEYRTRYGEVDDWWVGLSVRTPLALSARHPEVVVLPQHAFIPLLYDDFRLFTERVPPAELQDSYTVHLWETELSKTSLLPLDADYFRTRDNGLTALCRRYVEESLAARPHRAGRLGGSGAVVSRERVIDAFLFAGELDILELRLNVLDPVVDRFVLLESTVTFSGVDKPLWFAEHRERFAPWRDKITHVVVRDTPDTGSWRWGRERFQRDQLERGLGDCRCDDIVLVSDVDEIPDPEAVVQRQRGGYHQEYMLYHLNCRHMSEYWVGTVALFHFALAAIGPQAARDRRYGFARIERGGWHFAYTIAPDAFRAKLRAFSHAELDTAEHAAAFERRRDALTDVFARHPGTLTVLDLDNGYFPAYLKANRARWAHLLRDGSVVDADRGSKLEAD